jgi:hypothetical protein
VIKSIARIGEQKESSTRGERPKRTKILSKPQDIAMRRRRKRKKMICMPKANPPPHKKFSRAGLLKG